MFETFGYTPDPPDASDKNFTTELRPRLTRATAAGDVDLRAFTTESNQYSAGSCAGNATADAVEILNAVEGLPQVQLSRMFVYALARNLIDEDGDGQGDINQDHGVYLRLCFDVLSKFGICQEDLPVDQGGWPYDLKKLYTLPSLKAMRAATAHRIHSYYRITETGQDRLDAIIDALHGQRPVVFGTTVNKAFLSLTGEGPVGVPTSELVGGHAMIVVGYVASKGFLVKNSWGAGWGDNGFCCLLPEYLTWEATNDLWVPTKGSEFR